MSCAGRRMSEFIFSRQLLPRRICYTARDLLHSWMGSCEIWSMSVDRPLYCCNGSLKSMPLLQNWEFDDCGYMHTRDACINNVPIEDSVRRLQGWEIHDKA